jgi:hypothetical protein
MKLRIMLSCCLAALVSSSPIAGPASASPPSHGEQSYLLNIKTLTCKNQISKPVLCSGSTTQTSHRTPANGPTSKPTLCSASAAPTSPPTSPRRSGPTSKPVLCSVSETRPSPRTPRETYPFVFLLRGKEINFARERRKMECTRWGMK